MREKQRRVAGLAIQSQSVQTTRGMQADRARRASKKTVSKSGPAPNRNPLWRVVGLVPSCDPDTASEKRGPEL